MSQVHGLELSLTELQASLQEMGKLVESILDLAVVTILRPLPESRYEAARIDARIDALEIAIEERCHQLIALQSPMARDLRFLISATRVASELERLADLAESVVTQADVIGRAQAITNPPQLTRLGEIAQLMTHQALRLLSLEDAELLERIDAEEDQADSLTKECYRYIQFMMESDRTQIHAYSALLRAVGNLEIIADIARAIAKETQYIHRGLFVRHGTDHHQGEHL
jgi:phosphate transport system protein